MTKATLLITLMLTLTACGGGYREPPAGVIQTKQLPVTSQAQRLFTVEFAAVALTWANGDGWTSTTTTR